MSVMIKTKDGLMYIQMARGNGKSLRSLVVYCRSLGMTDEEIKSLFEEVLNNMED